MKYLFTFWKQIPLRSCICHFGGSVSIALVLLVSIAWGQNGSAQQSGEVSELEVCLTRSEELFKSNLDSALVYAQRAQSLVNASTERDLRHRSLVLLGDIYTNIGEMDRAMDYYLQAEALNDNARGIEPENNELFLIRTDVLMKIGVLHFYLKDYTKSLSHYDEALNNLASIAEKIQVSDLALRRLKIFNNMAAVYIQQEDYDKALIYFKNALESNATHGSVEIESSLFNNIGICHLEKGEHDLASHYFLKALEIRTASGDIRGQAQVLNNLGKNNAYRGDFNEALVFYQKALRAGREIGHGESTLISLQSLSEVYDTLGDYRNALHAFKEYKALNDSMFSLESKTAIAHLEDSYRRDKELKEIELASSEGELKAQRAEIRNIIVAGSLGLLVITAFFLIVVMRSKLRNQRLQQEKLRLEHENLDLESRTLKENLDYKDRELTANALFLLKNNELISRITENLLKAKSTFKQENQQIIQNIIQELQNSQDRNNWEEFEAHFTRVHAQFYQSLQDKFPNLTPNEKKLCAFLRLNMSTKDISAITYQSVNSITVARSRLRKKLNIEGEDVQLVNFLMSI
ncbi:MAG: tetratricopeptide repeat protein [Flavobacteriales bacterium]